MKHIPRILLVLALAALTAVFAACGSSSSAPQNPARPDREPRMLATGSGITVIKAADWAAEHPDIYASYMSNSENSSHYQYTEAHPYIKTLYEGMGFAFDYNSARSHVFSVSDVDATGRPHPFANCFACKTPDIHALIAEKGNEIYAIPYEELRGQIIESVSCFNCHANEPGQLTVTHQYVEAGLGNDFSGVPAESLACAQCHVEYYFDLETRAVTLPYSGLRSMSPDSILQYYNNTTMPDGQVYADYVNPRSGVRQIKIQHPEFETFYGSGSIHKGDFNCADCHMGYVDNADGKRIVNHKWMSPLEHPNLINETCSSCHSDLAKDVHALQEEVGERTDAIGEALTALMEELVSAVDSGRYSDEQLAPVRQKFREAQFYWDFVFVENSDGAHNKYLTHQLLEKAEWLYEETRELFAALG